jgi:hypothetical protein
LSGRATALNTAQSSNAGIALASTASTTSVPIVFFQSLKESLDRGREAYRRHRRRTARDQRDGVARRSHRNALNARESPATGLFFQFISAAVSRESVR